MPPRLLRMLATQTRPADTCHPCALASSRRMVYAFILLFLLPRRLTVDKALKTTSTGTAATNPSVNNAVEKGSKYVSRFLSRFSPPDMTTFFQSYVFHSSGCYGSLSRLEILFKRIDLSHFIVRFCCFSICSFLYDPA